MADKQKQVDTKAIKKDIDQQNKKLEASDKKIDKLDALFKKALKASKNIDEALK